MSPGSATGMSPAYSEPSPDYSMLVNQNRLPRPSSNSPPLNSSQQALNNTTQHIGRKKRFYSCTQLTLNLGHFSSRTDNTPSTLMGQFIEVLNNQANLDDLNLNLDIQGGLDCNVDEVSSQLIIFRQSIIFFFFIYTSRWEKFFKTTFFPLLPSHPRVHSSVFKVIKHELSYGPLDFNFQNNNNNQEGMVDTSMTINGGDAQQQHGQYQQARTSNSWVH